MKAPGIFDVVNEYDALGRLTKVIQGDRATEFAYGTNGYLCMVVNALVETNTIDTDLNGRGIRATMADGSTISNTYDRSEDPVATTLPQGTTHTFDYTAIGQTKTYQPPAAPDATQPELYTYNRDKQPTSLTRHDGTVVTNIFDTAGRISQVREIGGHNTSVSYAYDGSGRLSTLANNSGESIACAYDGGLLTNITYSGTISASLNCQYDNNFRISSVVLTQPSTLPSFHSSTSYSYDEDGALTSAGELSIGYDPTTGFLTDTRTPFDKITDLRSYNSYGEVDQYVAAVSASPVAAMQYQRDKLGRITNLTETVDGTLRAHAYTYDSAGRLTRATGADGGFRGYAYDANGNRTSIVSSAGPVTAEYDAQDRLMRYGDTTYDYNAAGDLTRAVSPGGTTAYDYDSFGNLRRVDLSDGNMIKYVVDAQNRRIGKTVNGSLTQRFVYQDQLKIAAELDGSGNVLASFVYGFKANVPEYMVKGTRKYRIITDHVGSVRLVIDFVTGAIAQRMTYDEFGNVIEDTNSGFQPFGFQGGLYDRDTQLVRFGARDYDPRVGRWTCKDPIMFAGGFNVYVFCGNDALNNVDFTGEWLQTAVGAGIGAVWGIASVAVHDAITGQRSGWQSYVAGAVGGATTGALISNFVHPAIAGAAGAAVGNATEQGLNILSHKQVSFNLTSCAADAAVGGALGWAVGGTRIAGINKGRNSMLAVARSNRTKLVHGPMNCSPAVQARSAIGLCQQGGIVEGSILFGGYCALRNTLLEHLFGSDNSVAQPAVK